MTVSQKKPFKWICLKGCSRTSLEPCYCVGGAFVAPKRRPFLSAYATGQWNQGRFRCYQTATSDKPSSFSRLCTLLNSSPFRSAGFTSWHEKDNNCLPSSFSNDFIRSSWLSSSLERLHSMLITPFLGFLVLCGDRFFNPENGEILQTPNRGKQSC